MPIHAFSTFLQRFVLSIVALPALVLAAGAVQAQDLLGEPDIRKVDTAERETFEQRFDNIQWTGSGFEGSTTLDRIPTSEIRARLQKVFGDPTQKLKHLHGQDDFRPAHYVQFEYWFIIDDEIPMMVLDIDGPFDNGLVFGGASRYVDLMPEIKRTLSRKLMEPDELGEFADHYYDLENEQWYEVSYMGGEFNVREIERPDTLQ